MADEFWYQTWGPPARVGDRPNLSFVLPELVVGEYPTPNDASWLRETHGVTAVINLQDDADLASKGLSLRDLEHAYRTHGMRFHHVPITDCDAAMLAARLDHVVQLVHEAVSGGHRVYLHCNAGMNRAPTIAIAYIHVHQGLALTAARDLVKQRRQCVPYMTVLEAHFATRTKA